ncbi:MAG: hypothetical protein QM715_04535 [Nibricoccus sp.]
MKIFQILLFSLAVISSFGGCKSFKWSTSNFATRPEQLKKSGAAADMAEAQRMADDHDWIENAQRKEDQERQKRAEAAAKK